LQVGDMQRLLGRGGQAAWAGQGYRGGGGLGQGPLAISVSQFAGLGHVGFIDRAGVPADPGSGLDQPILGESFESLTQSRPANVQLSHKLPLCWKLVSGLQGAVQKGGGNSSCNAGGKGLVENGVNLHVYSEGMLVRPRYQHCTHWSRNVNSRLDIPESEPENGHVEVYLAPLLALRYVIQRLAGAG